MQAASVATTSDLISPTQAPLQCVKCQQTLSQQRYILHDGLPYCIHCYETNYSNVCNECGLLIATDSKVTDIADFLANVNSCSCSLYVVVRPSVVCLSVTFVHPTQPIEIFGNVSVLFNTLLT